MSIETLLKEINEDVKDIVTGGFDIPVAVSDIVPSDEDPGLTFEVGKSKKGKIIDTCVLHIDIRNSTALNLKYDQKIIGRLYSAFIKSMIAIAEYEGASVRHIIGDRLMIVLEPKNCFTRAIDIATSVNTVCQYIIDKHFKLTDFKVGIGIDYGRMLVLKVGVPKNGKERNAYKNLVWLGPPANIASKLTDLANKTETKTNFVVNYSENTHSFYPTSKTETVDEATYIKEIGWVYNHGTTYKGGLIQNLQKNEVIKKTPPILMTEKVFTEFKRLNPERNSIKGNYWQKVDIKIKGYSANIYGGDITWSGTDKINI